MMDEDKKFSKRHWLGILFLMLVLGIIALSQRANTASSPSEEIRNSNVYPEFAAMYDASGSLGTLMQGSYSGIMDGASVSRMPVSYVMVDGLAVVEGDILIHPDMPRSASMGVENQTRYLWPDGVLYYEIQSSMPDQKRIHDAIAHWEKYTGMRFVQRTNQANYVQFRSGGGCSSYVGMQGGMQPITLAAACSTGNTIHEIGHALGLWHEQSRLDRDEHIEVLYENIISLYAFNFDKQTNNGMDLGTYDYSSIMHYPRWAFSKNGKDTIVPRGDFEIGQRDGLSTGDIAGIREMYGK